MVFPTVASWLYFLTFADREWMRQLYFGSKLVQAALPLLGWGLAGLPRDRLRRAPAAGWLAGAASGVLLAAGIGLAYLLFAGTTLEEVARAPIRARLEAFAATSTTGFLALAVALSLAHSLFEEYYWRWFLFGSLRRRLPRAAAVTVAAAAFATHHVVILHAFLGPRYLLAATLPFSAAVALGGVLWCLLYDRWRSLAAPWLSHALVDGAIMAVAWALVLRPGGP